MRRGRASQPQAGRGGSREEIMSLFNDVLLRIRELKNNQPLSFNQCINIFTCFDIGFCSPSDFKIFHKMFQLADKKTVPICRIVESIELGESQFERSSSSFLVKVARKGKGGGADQLCFQPSHPIENCIKSFLTRMKALHGRNINWFRAVRGTTIGLSIPLQIFEERFNSIMKKTGHGKCGSRVFSHFKDQKGGEISFSAFSKHVQNYQSLFLKSSREGKERSIFESLQQSRPQTTSVDQRRITRKHFSGTINSLASDFLHSKEKRGVSLNVKRKKSAAESRGRIFNPSRTAHSSFSVGDQRPFEEERRGERPSQGFDEIRVEGLKTGVRWR